MVRQRGCGPQPQLLQFTDDQTQSQTQLNRPRVFARRVNYVQPKRQVLEGRLQMSNVRKPQVQSHQSQTFKPQSQSVHLNEPFVFARRRTQPQLKGSTNVNSKNVKNASVKQSVNGQNVNPVVRRALNTPVQQGVNENVQRKELEGYLKLLNCKYPGHTQADCSSPPPFNANLAKWGATLRADYPLISPQEQTKYANKESFTNASMVKQYGKALGVENSGRMRTKPNWAQGARLYGL